MKYGYARVSTLNQGLANQVAQLKEAGATKVLKEKFTDRPEFNKLLEVLKPSDELVITNTIGSMILLKLNKNKPKLNYY